MSKNVLLIESKLHPLITLPMQVISDQLRDLSDQLNRMRGHYGDSLGAALNMQSAFNQFQQTVDVCIQ